MTTTQDRAAALSDRLLGQTLQIAEAAAVWLGHDLGWYGALRDGGPATPEQLATRTGTAVRYAREWLEQQAVAGILDREGEAYTLPAAHAEVLLDPDSPLCTEPLARSVLVAARQLPAIAAAARGGGGVPWQAYGPELSAAQGDGNRPALKHVLAREWVPQLAALRDRLERGARVADIGCGEGWAGIGLALHHPGITVTGFDLDEVALAAARRHAEEAGVADRVTFHRADAGTGLHGGPYDVAVAIECVHDMPQPVEVLRAVHAATTADALVYVIDMAADERLTAPGDETQRLLYGFSLLICLPDSMSHPGSAATGTVLRPATLDGYARQAGFAGARAEDVADTGFWRFYRLTR
ncbi:MAG TPA: class I SAM-dependent methyltransferase [Mycobacteriales bacterium]